MLDRRTFLRTTVAGTIAATTFGCTEDQNVQAAATVPGSTAFSHPIGFQSYGMRKEIGEDFTGTLNTVRELGYKSVEMCSPRGSHYKQAGFGKLTDLPPADVKKMIEDTGLACESAHFQSHEVLEDDPAATADYAAALGLKYLVMSGSGIGEEGTIDDFKRWGEQCNKVADIVAASGVKLGYHNHRIAPIMEDGKPQYEHIMEILDPDKIAMQFQFASIRDGFDLPYYLEKYAGRFISLHMHDFDPALKGRQPGRIGGIVPLGEGMVDWAACVKAALKSPMAEHGFIVEIETEEPLEGLRRSINYLKSLQV